MIYYFMLLGAAALFSIQFLFQQRFEKAYGTDLKSALVFSVGTGLGMKDTCNKEEMINDDGRIFYLREHLRMLSRAIKAGADVRGYYYWSNFDSFENAAGYTFRFGFNYVDFETGERTRKKSWYYYKKLIEDSCVD